MTKKSLKYFFAAPMLTVLVLGSTAFTKKAKSITNGGGVAEGHTFNYTALQNRSGTTGHFSWDGIDYSIVSVYRRGNTATIYLSNDMAVNVEDSKDGDWITTPFPVKRPGCAYGAPSPDTPLAVDTGNLVVHN